MARGREMYAVACGDGDTASGMGLSSVTAEGVAEAFSVAWPSAGGCPSGSSGLNFLPSTEKTMLASQPDHNTPGHTTAAKENRHSESVGTLVCPGRHMAQQHPQ